MAGGGVADLAAFLSGHWRIEREILDVAEAPIGRFSGWGRFRAAADEAGLLRYVEHGRLELGAHRGPAHRRLGYHVDGPTARVVFDDGRLFHHLDLRDGVCEVAHPCGADVYRGRLEVIGDGTWRHEWTVTGPHKRHTIRTVLERPR